MIKSGVKRDSIAIVVFVTLVFLSALSAFILSSSYSHADSSSTTASVTVSDACTMSAGGNTYTHTFTAAGGTITLTGDTIAMSCNDNAGFDVYAIGYSGNSYYDTNTDLIFDGDSIFNIRTNGDASSESYWKMKIESTGESNIVTIDNNYDNANFSNIPSTYTKIAHFNSNITSGTSSIIPSYKVYVSSTQPAGDYTGKVKYTMVHPNSAPSPSIPAYTPPTGSTEVPNNIHYMQDITAENKATVLASMTEETPYYLYDKRDNEIYVVAKLKDGNLWMLDNLRLDPTTLTQEQLYGTGANAGKLTNASNTSLGYLKNGGGTSSDQYPTAAINAVNWTSENNNYYSVPMTVNTYKNTTVQTKYGNGSGKRGVYYNYCAATAGSYCYGSAATVSESTGNATEDLCPAGWRMPTGGNNGEYDVMHGYYASDTASNTNSLQYNLSTTLTGYFKDGSVTYQDYDGRFWASTKHEDDTMDALYVDKTYIDDIGFWYRNHGLTMRCIVEPPMVNVTVSFDSHTTGVTLTNSVGDAILATPTTPAVSIKQGTTYYIAGVYDGYYGLDSWSTTSGGVIGNATQDSTTYVVTNTATLSVTSKQLSEPIATCNNKIPGITYMQDINSNNKTFIMNSLTTSTPDNLVGYYVYDKRDGEQYCVSKLQDGNLWLLDNLRLDPVTVSLSTLQGNTNATDAELDYLKNGGGTSSDRYATAGVIDWTSGNSYTAPLTCATYKNETRRNFGLGSGKRGVYYNFCAASAGSYCYSDNNNSNTSSGNATSDICPSSWRMPTGGDSGEYRGLFIAYSNVHADFEKTFSALLSGQISNGSPSNHAHSYYWSSTRSGNNVMYELQANTGYVYFSSVSRSSGHSVRCVLK